MSIYNEENSPERPGFRFVLVGSGFATGRPAHRVVCTRCEVVVHEGSTGPLYWAKWHDDDAHGGAGEADE